MFAFLCVACGDTAGLHTGTLSYNVLDLCVRGLPAIASFKHSFFELAL